MLTTVDDLRFTPELLKKPVARGLTVETTLEHLAIVTYWVELSSLRKHLHPRFEPLSLAVEGRSRRSLVSVVTFLDRDFRFVACPWITQSFGQTNYRAYVVDTVTGKHAVWFFGTCLDSVSVIVPRYVWKLPWYRARMEFDCRYDATAGRYTAYSVRTRSNWSPGTLSIDDTGQPPTTLTGVSNVEAGLVLLTHPLRGYFFRRDRALGSYSIWHGRTMPTVGIIREARYPLLERLELVAEGCVDDVHSVLVQPRIDFTIYLPPRKTGSEDRDTD